MNTDLKIMYENQGYLHLPGIIPQDLVARVHKAFDKASARHHEEWRRDVAEGKADARFYDIPNILDEDDAFVDLVSMPELVPILLETVGPDLQLNHTHARVFPPGKTFTAPWHSDLANTLGIDLGHSANFFVKVHFYFEDLLPNQGCLAFLPGTHRLPREFPRPKLDKGENSVAAVKIVPKAGDAVLFNTHLLHMALDNSSPLPRKSLIYAYSHFWVKNYANSVPSNLDKYATTPLTRQLFGVEEEGVSYFDQRYDTKEKAPASTLESFSAASKRVFKRLRKMSSITRA